MLPWLLMQGGVAAPPAPPAPTPTPSPAPAPPIVPPVVPPEPGFIVPGSSGAGVVVVERRPPWRLHPSGRRMRGHLTLSSLPTHVVAAGTVAAVAVPAKAAGLQIHAQASLTTSVSQVALMATILTPIRGQGLVGKVERSIQGHGAIRKRKQPADEKLEMQFLGFDDS